MNITQKNCIHEFIKDELRLHIIGDDGLRYCEYREIALCNKCRLQVDREYYMKQSADGVGDNPTIKKDDAPDISPPPSFCLKCGAVVSGDLKFCSKCGNAPTLPSAQIHPNGIPDITSDRAKKFSTPPLSSNNRSAVTALVFGIISIVFGLFLFPIVFLPLSIVGICLAKASKNKKAIAGIPTGLSKAALVLCIIGAAFSFVGMIIGAIVGATPYL
jgi:hypothetical protein